MLLPTTPVPSQPISRAAVEPLERRTLLTVFLNDAGLLYVGGTDGHDKVFFFASSAGPGTLVVRLNGADTEFDQATISAIQAKAGEGDDRVELAPDLPLPATLLGQLGNDTLVGGAGADRLSGGADDDSVRGGAGDDIAFGDSEHDTLAGGDGADTLMGGEGNDRADGRDLAASGFDPGDLLYGQGGDDFLADADTLSGGDGNDSFSSFGGLVLGGAGDDSGLYCDATVYGQDGNDTLTGAYHGAGRFYGGEGDDTLATHFRDSSDLLDGGNGNDTLTAEGGGSPTLLAGPGADTLRATPGPSGYPSPMTLDAGEDDDVDDIRCTQLAVLSNVGEEDRVEVIEYVNPGA